MINLDKALQQLRERKEMVDRAITQLEELMKMPAGDVGRSRRGRKSMDDAERLRGFGTHRKPTGRIGGNQSSAGCKPGGP